MRFVERTRRKIRIAPRQNVTDSIGGVREAFSDVTIPAYCAVTSSGNTLSYSANALVPMEHGVSFRQAKKLLLPPDTPIHVGDGVCMPGESSPRWRCITLETWSSHLVAKIERLP